MTSLEEDFTPEQIRMFYEEFLPNWPFGAPGGGLVDMHEHAVMAFRQWLDHEIYLMEEKLRGFELGKYIIRIYAMQVVRDDAITADLVAAIKGKNASRIHRFIPSVPANAVSLDVHEHFDAITDQYVFLLQWGRRGSQWGKDSGSVSIRGN